MRHVRKGWSLAYKPNASPDRRPRWQPPGKLFDFTVITLTVIFGFLSMY